MNSSLRAKQRWHDDCIYSYKQLAKKWSGKPYLKKAWNDRTSEGKIKWFKTRRDMKQRGVKRSYDDFAMTQEAEHAVYADEHHVDEWVPWEEFLIRGRQLGKSLEDITNEWDEAVLDDTRSKKHACGHRLVHIFKGVRKLSGSRDAQISRETQRAVNLDTERAQLLRSQVVAAHERHLQTLMAQSSALSSAATFSSREESVLEFMVVSPVMPPIQSLAASTFMREVQHREQHAKYLAELDAKDEQAALDAIALQRGAAQDAKRQAAADNMDASALRNALVPKVSSLREQVAVTMCNLKEEVEAIERELTKALNDICSDERKQSLNEQLAEVKGTWADGLKELEKLKADWLAYKVSDLTTAEQAREGHEKVKAAGADLRGSSGVARTTKKAVSNLKKEIDKALREAAKGKLKETMRARSTHDN